jgi:hypothetical protein
LIKVESYNNPSPVRSLSDSVFGSKKALTEEK